MNPWIPIASVAFILNGCSSRQVYESIRANREQQCRTLQGDARAQCLAPYEKSYDEYRRQREAEQAGSKD